MKKVLKLLLLAVCLGTLVSLSGCQTNVSKLTTVTISCTIINDTNPESVIIENAEQINPAEYKVLCNTIVKVKFVPKEDYRLFSYNFEGAEFLGYDQENYLYFRVYKDAELTVLYSSTVISTANTEYFIDDNDITLNIISKDSGYCYLYVNDTKYGTSSFDPAYTSSYKISKKDLKTGENKIYLENSNYEIISNTLTINLTVENLPEGYTPVLFEVEKNESWSKYTISAEGCSRYYLHYYFSNTPSQEKTYITTSTSIYAYSIPFPTSTAGNLVMWIEDPVLKLYSNKVTIEYDK